MVTTQRQTVMVVDDVPDNIQVLHKILKQDYRVIYASDGATAIDLALSRPPDLILLDIMMPNMDGYEVCRLLKEDPLTRDIPVIFVTALDGEEDEARGLALGAIDYIVKPVRPPIVQIRVKNHLELKRRGDMLMALSYKDGLTGIDNRRRFDELLEREWRRCARNGCLLSLIICDVDHFKLYNDYYGHLAGDDCLRRVAGVLEGALQRPTDYLARYGGEEFACLLSETDMEGARSVAERMRKVVHALSIEHERSPVASHVTVSFGLATLIPEASVSPEKLIEQADQALYQAKSMGRDRMHSWEEITDS